MENQDGGDNAITGSPDDPTRGGLPPPYSFPSGGGEVIVPLVFEDTEKKELLSSAGGKRDVVSPSQVTPVVQIKPHIERAQREESRSKLGAARDQKSGLDKLVDEKNAKSDLVGILLGIAGVSLVAFLVCFFAAKVLMGICGAFVCFPFHSAREGAQASLFTTKDQEDYCVFQRFEPHHRNPVLEIIHDYKSRHSALLEYRNGLRCMLFDMRPYIKKSSPCPEAYPNSLDERVGVPAVNSRLTRAFPRRFARHFFANIAVTDSTKLRDLVGPTIAEQCRNSQLYAALLVETRVKTRLCLPGRQFVVDELISMTDPSYRRLRSRPLSNMFAMTVTMFENWNKTHTQKRIVTAKRPSLDAAKAANESGPSKQLEMDLFVAETFPDLRPPSVRKNRLESRLNDKDGDSIENAQKGNSETEGAVGEKESPDHNVETTEGVHSAGLPVKLQLTGADVKKDGDEQATGNKDNDDDGGKAKRAKKADNEKNGDEQSENTEDYVDYDLDDDDDKAEPIRRAIDGSEGGEHGEAKPARMRNMRKKLFDDTRTFILKPPPKDDDAGEVDVAHLPAHLKKSLGKMTSSSEARPKREVVSDVEESGSAHLGTVPEEEKSAASSLLSLVYPPLEINAKALPQHPLGKLVGTDLFEGLQVKSEVRRYYSWRGQIVRVCLRRNML